MAVTGTKEFVLESPVRGRLPSVTERQEKGMVVTQKGCHSVGRGWMLQTVSLKSHVESLTPSVMGFGGGGPGDTRS